MWTSSIQSHVVPKKKKPPLVVRVSVEWPLALQRMRGVVFS